MYPETKTNANPRPLISGLIVIIIALVLVAVWQIISAVKTAHKTGVINITASDENATISITASGRTATTLGTGSTSARLTPGTYLVAAYRNGMETEMVVPLVAGQSKDVSLDLSARAKANNQNVRPSLYSLLPFIGPAATYQIDSSTQPTDHGTETVIVITADTESGHQAALKWITDQGYKLTDYTINYQQASVQNYHYTDGLPQ